MRVIVTGSREWSEVIIFSLAMDVMWRRFAEHSKPGDQLTVVHGACPTGADYLASLWCQQKIREGQPVIEEKHPAQWRKLGKRAGIVRNEEMVAAGADLVLAFPLPQGKGTQHAMKISRAKNIHVINYGREA